MQELTAWENFYVITGSSAAALTGLMFVVITLVAGQERLENAADGVETFSSPTVVHFCAALLVSGILSAPWHSLIGPNIMLALTGLYGVGYAARVIWRISHQSVYSPGFDDWMWFAITPLLSYAALVGAAIVLVPFSRQALFAVAAATLLLIFVGIRNAWDTVTYIAIFDPTLRRDRRANDGGESVPRVDADGEDRNLLR